ncbi:unnamed protein product [Owenia fusiformis]|uniref:Coiled-coil domain-containing protein 86 n=1 Tax=Owenia fusiformis TaxID=6347 RepID=A0A8J1TKC5_OWEFU|nr:unnamed protein product [Owenia fusiformis]
MTKTVENTTAPEGTTVPRGKPKSGRLWKPVRTERHSNFSKPKTSKSSWARKMEEKNLKKAVKSYEKELQTKRAEEKELKRKRQEEHHKVKAENQKKAEVVQPIKNLAKLKRMKKKSLRKIVKR